MGQHQKPNANEEHNAHKIHEHSDIVGPFTEQEKMYIRLANEQNQLKGKHHHANHNKVAYERPKDLTLQIGLYAIKKLDAICPDYLSAQERRLLKPVAPGFLSYIFYSSIIVSIGGYSTYIYKSVGFKGFGIKAILPLFGLGLVYKVGDNMINNLREQYFYSDRLQMVQKYSKELGQNYLLDILDPNFRIKQ